MKDKPIDVIAAGHLCLDLHPHFTNEPGLKVQDIIRPGTLVKMGGITFSTGGSVSNTGFALKLFGCSVGFVAKVGNDAFGQAIIDIVKAQGNAEGILTAEGETTSYTVVLSPAGIDRIFLHYPGTNDTFSADDIDFSVVSRARLFHLGYPTLMEQLYRNEGAELARIYRNAKKEGVSTSMDISLPDPASASGAANWRKIYEAALPFVDIYTPSIEEAFFSLHPAEYLERKNRHGGEELIDHISPDEFQSLAGELLDFGCALVALKAGHNGWYLRTAHADRLKSVPLLADSDPERWADRHIWRPAFQVDAIASATGSGDTSIAAFLTALLRGKSLEEALKLANCAGSMNLRGMDALSGLCSWQEMEEAADSLPMRHIPALEQAAWQWNEQSLVWETE